MKIFKWMLLLGAVLVVSACSRSIDQPTASRQLVENVVEPDKTLLPEVMWETLAKGPVHAQLQVSNYQITLLEAYYSASGKSCRRFEAEQLNSNESSEVRVACKADQGNAWYLSNPAVSNLTFELQLGS